MADKKSGTKRLRDKLAEQIRFVQRSCRAFDAGEEDEAVRIATSLRVIFHQTTRSQSLIRSLKLSGKKMLSSWRGLDGWKNFLSHEICLSSPTPIKMVPILGDQFRPISMKKWWERETVFAHDGRQYSRKLIVLSAANKDGGAHVDELLEEYYEVLCSGKYAFGITGNLEFNGPPPFPQGVTQYPANAHLALIRQFAHETLATVQYYGWK